MKHNMVTDQPIKFDAAFFTDPYPTYARLRHAGPAHPVTSLEQAPVWLLTRYADVRAALADPCLAAREGRSDEAHATSYWLSPSSWMPPEFSAIMHNQQPPDHTRLRRLVAPAFTPRRVEGFRRRIQKITDQMLDAIAPHGRADLIASFSGPLPITIIGELQGIPLADRAEFRRWINAQVIPGPNLVRRGRQAAEEMFRYLRDLIARKRAEPSDDLLSVLIAARDTEDRLSEDELISMAMIIHSAGAEPTSNLISNGLLALLRHPDQLAALRADPSLLPIAVEELLRYDTPTQVRVRYSEAEARTIGGITIPAGQSLALLVGSANRDPDRFPEPNVLDVTRVDNAHLSFGYGFRFCIGAPLVRLVGQIALGTLLHRFPNIALAVDVERLRWRHSIRLRGLHELPVTF